MNSEKLSRPIFREHEPVSLIRIVSFLIFLAPISLVVAGDGVSANYLFVLLLLFARSYKRNTSASIYVIFMFISWLIGLIIFSKGDEFFILRQTISFGIALAATLLLFIRLRLTIYEIQLAITIAAVIYSIFVITMILANNFSLSDIYFIKGGLREYVPDWPQRFVIVLLLATFICFERLSASLLWLFSFLLVLLCIFLTFTRAAWIGLVFGFASYFAAALFRKRHPLETRVRITALLRVVLFLLPLLTLPFLFPLIGDALQRVWSATFDVLKILMTGESFDRQGSEGTRIEIWSEILSVLISNPFTGSGFAGASLTLQEAGSAHSQYLDVLLRTGVLGLIFYLFFWIKVMRFYWGRHVGIMAGLVAIFVFGFFHETTKLSYGALIFFTLLNKAYEDSQVGIASSLIKRT